MTFGAKANGSDDLKDIALHQEKINSYIKNNNHHPTKKNVKKIKSIAPEQAKISSQACLDADYTKKPRRTTRSNDSAKVHCDCGGTCNKSGKTQFKSSLMQRYKCTVCKKYRWINLYSNSKNTKFTITSLILEQICKGMSLSKAGSTLRNIESKTYTAAGVLNILHTELAGLRMVSDEIESTFNYGKIWSVDETSTPAKGGESKRHIYVVGAIDTETKAMIKLESYDSRPDKKVMTDFLLYAAKKAGHNPDTIISDAYASYEPAIKKAFGSNTKHNKRNLTRKHQHNNQIERHWKTLKSELLISKNRRFVNADAVTKYLQLYYIYYNHIRIHSTITTTPAVCAGYKGETIESFASLLEKSHKPDILFVSKLGTLVKKIDVRVDTCCVTVFPKFCDEKTWKEINKILQPLGFYWSKLKRWILKTDKFDQRKKIIEKSTGREAALKPFSVCSSCKTLFLTRSDVKRNVSYYKARNGNLLPRSICKECYLAKRKRKNGLHKDMITLDEFFTGREKSELINYEQSKTGDKFQA